MPTDFRSAPDTLDHLMLMRTYSGDDLLHKPP